MPEETNTTLTSDEFDRGEGGKLPNIKKLFLNKNFAILIVLTILIAGTTIFIGKVNDNTKKVDNILIAIQNGNLTRTVIRQVEQINFLNECIKTKSEAECRIELNSLIK